MPNRVLRDGLLTSAVYNALGACAQSFYVRLILVADDFGCFDGREEVIASKCFPTFIYDQIANPTVLEMLDTLHSKDMVVRYSNKSRPYIAITQWTSDYRGDRRFPAPPVDVDLPGEKIRGKYNRPIGWRNPPGHDPVSVLLDAQLKPVVPQPLEWRPLSHYSLVTLADSDGSAVTKPQRVVTGSQSLRPDRSHCGPIEVEVGVTGEVGVAGGVEVGVTGPQSLGPPTTSTTPNGEEIIKFNNGAFIGVTETQRLAWQEMFDAMSIPDQIDRAAAWLAVNRAEREAIENRGEGFGSFIVRWLLREARTTTKQA